VVSKIQGKALNLVGYRLNLGVCRALRQYLENLKNALTRIVLDNNGIASGDVLSELLQGIASQDDFKSIIIIKNTVDEASASILIEMLKRPFPKNLEELRIVNCKISPVSTHKLLQAVSESQLKKLSLSGAQINEAGLDLLSGMLAHLRSLMDLDISWNGLRPNSHLKKFLEALGANRTL